MKLRFELEEFPFDEGLLPQEAERKAKLLPFVLEQGSRSTVMRQILGNDARALLHAYYEKGGYVSTPLGEGEFAIRQGQDVFNAIQKAMKATGKLWKDSKVLEIGSSYGYLLHCAREAGAMSVLGVEPGDEGIIGSQKYGIPYLQDFFPTPKLDQDFDVIFTHCVLEHIEELHSFISAMIERLHPGGLLFVAVPECEKKLRIGDISIISHQHVNYFTTESLKGLFTLAGLEGVTTIASSERAILYGWATKSNAASSSFDGSMVAEVSTGGIDVLAEFALAFQRNISILNQLVNETQENGGTVGLYGISSVLCGLLMANGCRPRLFDIDRTKHGKFIAGCESPIEPPEELITNPVDRIFICPIDYDQEIRSWLKENGFHENRIVSLLEIFEKNMGHPYRSAA